MSGSALGPLWYRMVYGYHLEESPDALGAMRHRLKTPEGKIVYTQRSSLCNSAVGLSLI